MPVLIRDMLGDGDSIARRWYIWNKILEKLSCVSN